MISTMRKSFGKNFTKVLMWITIFSLAGISSFVGIFRKFSGLPQHTVAEVAGYDISLLDFKRKTAEEERRLSYLKQQFGPYAELYLAMNGLSANPQESALQALIQERLISFAADQLSLELSKEYVVKKLEDPGFALQVFGEIVPPYVYDALGGLDSAKLSKYLQRQGLTIGAFEDMLEQLLRRHMVMRMLLGSSYITHADKNAQYIKQYAPRTFGVFSADIEVYEQKARAIKPSAEELKAYFEAQNAESKKYWTPEKRSGKVWIFDPSQYGITVSEEEITAAYTKHKQSFVEQGAEVSVRKIVVDAEQKAQQLYTELKQYPARFAEHANKQVEVITQKSKEAADIKQAAFGLMKDGDVSLPVKTDKGFVILGRVQRKEATYKPLQAVKDQVAARALQDRFVVLFKEEGSQQQAAAQEVFAAFARQKKAAEHSVPLIEKASSAEEKALFSLTAPGARTAFVHEGKGYVVQLGERVISHAADFSAVEKQVERDYILSKAHNAMKEHCSEIVRLIKQGTAPEKIASTEKVKFQKISVIGEKDPQWEQLSQKGMPVHQMTFLTTPGLISQEVGDSAGYVVYLIEHSPLNEQENIAEKASMSKDLISHDFQKLAASFIASLQKNATISINHALISGHMPR